MTAPPLTSTRRHALRCLLAAACAPLPLAVAVAAPELPGDSIYQLRPPLTDQNGQPFELATLRGDPALVSMFYSSCEMVCPMIFETIAMTVKALAPAQRDRVKVLMISFDPARDTVAVLKRTAEAHQCDRRWTLARTGEAEARKVAAVLGVQYRRLASGEFNHSSTIEMLDAQGRIAARTGMLGTVDPAMLRALQLALAKSA
jgi:protein SCO1/2